MGLPVSLILWQILMTSTAAKLIDLSHKHDPDTIMSPHSPHFKRETIFAGEYIPGVYAEGGKYSSGEHGGTHMDAPVHFQKGGKSIDEIPLEKTIADGVMVDCSMEASNNNTYLVPLQKLLDWEDQNGQIPNGAAVIFNFGWSSKFSNRTLYLGSDINEQFTFVFPAVSEEAGMWLLEQRDIQIIGSDTYSLDPFIINGQKVTRFPIHQTFLPQNRLMVENLNGTESLPPRGFRFHAAPVKFVGASGAQIRAYAMTYE